MTNKACTTKELWREHQKKEALKSLELLLNKVKNDEIKVVSSYLQSSGVEGRTTFGFNVEENS